MSRELVTIWSNADRGRVQLAVAGCEPGTRIEIRAPKRSIPQNSLLWGLLGDVSAQKEHCGRKYPPECWKVIFMAALGCEVQFVPSLDGNTFLPLGRSSSALSKAEMTDLLEFIVAWGTQNGVRFSHVPPIEECAA